MNRCDWCILAGNEKRIVWESLNRLLRSPQAYITYIDLKVKFRCGSRIWSGGAPGSEADSCWRSEAESCERSEQFATRVQGHLSGPGSFWVFNAWQFSHILGNSLFVFQHQKLIKIEHYIVLQSIWDILIYYTYYLIFMKKLCFD